MNASSFRVKVAMSVLRDDPIFEWNSFGMGCSIYHHVTYLPCYPNGFCCFEWIERPCFLGVKRPSNFHWTMERWEKRYRDRINRKHIWTNHWFSGDMLDFWGTMIKIMKMKGKIQCDLKGKIPERIFISLPILVCFRIPTLYHCHLGTSMGFAQPHAKTLPRPASVAVPNIWSKMWPRGWRYIWQMKH